MAPSYILKNFGSSFATRDRGRELRKDLLSQIQGNQAILDFAGVTNISYSFADEFMGKLSAAGFDLDFINMAPAVERSVRRAVSRRSGSAVSC